MPKGHKTKAVHWLPIIEAWKKSGLTKKDFCQQSNISYKTFYRWYYKFHKPELTAKFLDKSTTPSFANFIPIKVSEADKKTPEPEQHCTLLFNDKLQLQIPVEVMNTHFLQMLMAASGARSC